MQWWFEATGWMRHVYDQGEEGDLPILYQDVSV
jgi:hypothetical protein